MSAKFKNNDSYKEYRRKRRKTWQGRLLYWTWMTIVILVSVTFWVALSIVYIMVGIAWAFITGPMTTDSNSHRQLQRAKGDFRWG